MKAGDEDMMDPGMMGAPLPPEAAARGAMGAPQMGGAMGAPQLGGVLDAPAPESAMAGAPMSPIEAVVMALKGMQVQRKGENDALMMAVLQATGAMPSGLEGVAEGSAMAVPAAPADDAGMGY